MNEKDLDFGTLDLEDIIKEFGGGKDPILRDEMLNTTSLNELIASVAATAEEPAAEESAAEEPAEEVSAEEIPEEPAAEEPAAEEPEAEEEPAAEPAEEAPAEEAEEEHASSEEQPEEEPLQEQPEPEFLAVRESVEEPTVRLNDIAEAAARAAQAAENVPGEVITEPEEPGEPTVRLNDITEALEKAAEAKTEGKSAAPAAPEYDDEDDDEVELPNLPPLLFKPKSRLQRLRSELVAGPEKRYYELSELGVGKLQLAIFACLVVVLLSGGTALMFSAGMIAVKRMKLMIFGQVLALLLSAFIGSGQLIDGLCDVLRGRFTLNTLLLCSFISCCVDAVLCLMEERVPLCAAFSLQMAMSLWATYHKRTTEMGQMDSLRKAVRLDAVVKHDAFYEGKTGYLRREGQVSDFMEHYDKLSGPEKIQNGFALLSLLAAMAIAIVAGVQHSVSMGFQILSTTLLVAAPASMFITLTRPAALVERKLHSMGTVLCGWSGVKGMGAKGVLLLNDRDLFPLGTAKLNGVKFYGERNPEEVIAYACALIEANGGCLVPIFQQLLESRGGIRYDAQNLHHYGNGGIGGEVCGEPVLIGTGDFLKTMGVEIPEGTMVKQAVYISIDGEFSGLFAINYTRTKFSVGGIATLSTHRRITPVVVARDFMLTGAFLKEKFGISDKRLVFPARAVQEELAAKTPDAEAPALALTTQEGLAPVAYAITGASALKAASRLGVTIHIIGGLLGILIMLALAIVGSVHLLTPLHVLMYQVVWMIPGLLVTMWPYTI